MLLRLFVKTIVDFDETPPDLVVAKSFKLLCSMSAEGIAHSAQDLICTASLRVYRKQQTLAA